jgi:hypothetical protein
MAVLMMLVGPQAAAYADETAADADEAMETGDDATRDRPPAPSHGMSVVPDPISRLDDDQVEPKG